jgi:hypothetical protein
VEEADVLIWRPAPSTLFLGGWPTTTVPLYAGIAKAGLLPVGVAWTVRSLLPLSSCSARKRTDKDHAGDPMSFVPIFHSKSTRIEIFQQREERHLKKRNESSKQHDEDHHASNLSLIILDEHKNPHSNLY